jgi:hypothetical protein
MQLLYTWLPADATDPAHPNNNVYYPDLDLYPFVWCSNRDILTLSSVIYKYGLEEYRFLLFRVPVHTELIQRRVYFLWTQGRSFSVGRNGQTCSTEHILCGMKDFERTATVTSLGWNDRHVYWATVLILYSWGWTIACAVAVKIKLHHESYKSPVPKPALTPASPSSSTMPTSLTQPPKSVRRILWEIQQRHSKVNG